MNRSQTYQRYEDGERFESPADELKRI